MAPSTSGTVAMNATEVFRKEFDGYQKMTAADYLEHSLLFGSVQDVLKQQEKPLRILDLGCGDAANLSKMLSAMPECVASYTGVDMSESALATAKRFMEEALGKQAPVFFHISDMLSFLQQNLASYDVVLASFALHHLTSEDKLETMKAIRSVLAEGGAFIMVDPFRRPGEDLKAYRQRASEVGETWVDMGRERQTTFIKHMQDYDIVEEESFFDQAWQAAGFSGKDVICRGKKGLQSNVAIFKA